MKILYTPAGDTDPIRGFRDGAILHIIRHYNPDKVVVFLSADMAAKEEKHQIYSKAINHLSPNCELTFIKKDIEDVHKMEELVPLAEEFIKIRKRNLQAEILLNLSSGTPQMKTIMSFLATDFDNVRAIQVASPEKSSNRRNFANQDGEDIETIIETNEDDEPCSPNRCSEPRLRLYRRYRMRYQMLSLLDSYEYSSALKLYEQNKNMFDERTGKLLQHAVVREELKLDEALKIINKVEGINLRTCKNREIENLNEFFMVMELRQKKKQLPEFIVKITPFLYFLAKFYFVQRLKIKLEDFTEPIRRNHYKIKSEKLLKAHPQMYASLQATFNNRFRDNTDLAFSNLLGMLEGYTACDKDVLNLFHELRTVEEKQRNFLAHTIAAVTERDLENIEPYLDSKQILDKLRAVFFKIMEGEEFFKKNIYDSLNLAIKKSMDDYKI